MRRMWHVFACLEFDVGGTGSAGGRVVSVGGWRGRGVARFYQYLAWSGPHVSRLTCSRVTSRDLRIATTPPGFGLL